MIPGMLAMDEDSGWRQQLRQAWRDPRALLTHLDHDPDSFALSQARGFPFLVTRAFADRMRPGDRDDPLLRQVLPLAEEARALADYGIDPVGDRAARAVPGMLQKYSGRALLITTAACPIHCRYCFRREFDYAADRLTPARLEQIVGFLSRHPDIDEVLLSGGDPLMWSTKKLRQLSTALARVESIRRLRIHSRVPVTLPARVDPELGAWFGTLPWQSVVVIHANHAREFDREVAAALHRLRNSGATVFNQAVLLAGVNDTTDALVELMHASFAAGAVPYYLHQLDRVRGSAHFEVDDRRARALIRTLRRELPGYLVPKLVREVEGMPSKTPLA